MFIVKRVEHMNVKAFGTSKGLGFGFSPLFRNSKGFRVWFKPRLKPQRILGLV